jgi:hypothetical protein
VLWAYLLALACAALAYPLWPPDPIAPPARLGTLLGFDENPSLFERPGGQHS